MMNNFDIKDLRVGNTLHYKPSGLWQEVDGWAIHGMEVEAVKPPGIFSWEAITLTSEIFWNLGFEGEPWFKKSLGLAFVGENGFDDLTVGRFSDGTFGIPVIDQGTNEGFTIQQAAKIQKDFLERNPDKKMDDKAFTPLKIGDTIVLRPIRFLHELQNLWYVLTHQELVYPSKNIHKD